MLSMNVIKRFSLLMVVLLTGQLSVLLPAMTNKRKVGIAILVGSFFGITYYFWKTKQAEKKQSGVALNDDQKKELRKKSGALGLGTAVATGLLVHGSGKAKADMVADPVIASSGRVIKFYDKTRPYYEFTNFYKSSVSVQVGGGAPIQSSLSEGLFQYFKFYGTPAAAQVKHAFDTQAPFQAYSSLKTYSASIIPSWHQVKLYVMYAVVKAKFEQSPTLLQQLKATQSAELIEHILGTRFDSEWGDSVDAATGLPGKNWLGKVLMLVRKELCGIAYPTTLVPGTSGTMQEFEQALATHKQRWLTLYTHEIKGVASLVAPIVASPIGTPTTGGMTKDGTPIWRDAAGATFAYAPAKKRFHRWNMTGDQNSSFCWGSAY